MSEPLKLGLIITTDQGRDAIHIAVAPVSADVMVYPAQHVGLVAGTTDKVSPLSEPHIGIVDPYLRHAAVPGQRFWLCLFPQTVTSLRHEWTHPAFAPQAVADSISSRKVVSTVWVTNYAKSIGLNYIELMEGASDFLKNGNYLSRGSLLEGLYLDGEFWDHYQIITETVVPDSRRDTFFSCSC